MVATVSPHPQARHPHPGSLLGWATGDALHTLIAGTVTERGRHIHKASPICRSSGRLWGYPSGIVPRQLCCRKGRCKARTSCAVALPRCRLHIHSSDAMCHTGEGGDLLRLYPPEDDCQHGIPTVCFPHLLRCILQGILTLKEVYLLLGLGTEQTLSMG